jgi:hypothetical protein
MPLSFEIFSPQAPYRIFYFINPQCVISAHNESSALSAIKPLHFERLHTQLFSLRDETELLLIQPTSAF